MIDTFTIYEELSASLGDAPARVITKALSKIHDELANSVNKHEFNELKEIVADLAAAQHRTEMRLESIAQKFDELAEAQRKTEIRLEELAEAQHKTEETLSALIKRVDNIEIQLGGLSMVVGYGLEDKLYQHINKFIQKVFLVEPINTILRKYINYDDGRTDEVNIYTECKAGNAEILVVGECKAQPGKKDIDRFVKMCERVKKCCGKEVYEYIIGYTFMPDIETYIKNNYPQLKFYRNYEIEYGKY